MRKIYPILFCIFLLTSCNDYNRISPKNLENIYYDIFRIDEVTTYNTQFVVIADSTAVYKTIFAQYGHTVEDFAGTIEYYLEKPDKFKKILRKVRKRLAEQEAIHSQRHEERKNNLSKKDNTGNISGY